MKSVEEILNAVKDGNISIKRAEKLLKLDAIAVVGELARLDYNRYLRRGVPEIVYAPSKSDGQISAIVTKLARTRINSSSSILEKIEVPIILSKVLPRHDNIIKTLIANSKEFRSKLKSQYFKQARIIAIRKRQREKKGRNGLGGNTIGRVALLAAGTSDGPALSEAEVILNLLGCRTIRFNDVGVAGLKRLVTPFKKIMEFDPDVIIVAAGMEGALPSVVAGLSSVPVIGLPTSVGYGYGKGGEAALMSMLQACPLGISVVNIDAGVAAGVIAWMISSRASKKI